MAQIDFTYLSHYYYLKGKDAVALGSNWKDPGFDYSAWPAGNAPFRYGDGTGGTELTDMMNSYTTLYLRSTFICTNKDLIKELTLLVDYDDGFIIWINGVEVLRRNAPSFPSYNSVATANHEAGTGEQFKVDAAPLNLIDGTNTIAVQGFNVSLTSSDFYFDLSVSAEQDLPMIVDPVGIDISVESGFFEAPFSVVLTSADPTVQIVYTLDGSNPQNSAYSITSDSPVLLQIDPSSTSGRAATPAVVLRASVTRPGYKPSIPASRTYIFLDKVKNQTWPGGNWPNYNINGQIIDLAMDNEIVNDPDYSGQIDGALTAIPSISVITDMKNLFDPASGIYVNAFGHGINWEKECSVELIQPDGTGGFNVNAGLRIRGGWSRHDEFPKHSFRLFFREEYGNDKLRFPLFGNEGVDQFDKIDLRTEQNYAWSNGFASNSFVREVFSRDSQRDMGQPYTRSRYYHLYLNGMYWGLYQTQERSEARYAQSYFGESEDEYDVVKVNTEDGYNIEATDGTLDSWQVLWNMCQKGFASNADYFRIEGRNQYGKPVKGGKIMVDLDNLIDFMMVIFYTGNFDSPTASFMQNKGSNNFYAIDNREDNSKGFTFYVHDAEHSLFDEAHSPGIGLHEDRVNIGTRTDNMRMQVNDFIKFHPQWIHFKLSANTEYRIRFADRAYKHLSEGGVFSPENSLERINKRINEVDLPIIAESARWGDAKTVGSFPYNKNEHWLPEINKIRNKFIPYRTDIVKGQLRQAGLYPAINAPVLSGTEGEIIKTDVVLTSPVAVNIKNPNGSGTIYYTLNGIDPRSTGGVAYSESLFSTRDIILPVNASALIKARVFSGGQWSALKQVNFIRQQDDFSKLKVTELHYHPPDHIVGTDTTDGKDLEFIEFKNTGQNAINLTGLALDSAVHYQFPDNILLAPMQFYVIASKPSKFYNYYGLIASGNSQGNYSNAGEEVLLKDASGNSVINFIYEDSSPWPTLADGDGYSLSSAEINPSGDPSNVSYWTTSVIKGGTPFSDNVLNNEETPELPSDGKLIAYPNPTTGILTIRFAAEEVISNIELILTDITGKRVKYLSTGNPGMVDLASSGLPAGIYILHLNSSKYKARLRIILLR
ncbi:MAG TPA: CotH kinase family protein [Bacteroidales bacterium]|nr:CotH kinase family protein [Bacteroidales bacterium]